MGKRAFSTCVLAALIVASFMAGSSISAAGPTDAPKKWTVGLYWATDNDLDPETQWYPDAMNFPSDFFPDLWENSLTNRAEVGLAVFMDELDGARTIVMEEDGWVETQTLGNVNSSDPEVLQDFVEYFMTEDSLDAEHYILIIMDHGLGYLGIVRDEGEPVTWMMSMDGLRGALLDAAAETGKKLDIVDLDACCMSTVEVAYELIGTADYMIASQMTVAMDGQNYVGLLEGLSEDPDMTPLELARNIVDYYEDWYSAPWPFCNQWWGYDSRDLQEYPTIYPYMQDFATLSVIDLSLISVLGDMFAAFSEAVLPKDESLLAPLEKATRDNFMFKWENNMCVGFNADVIGMFGDLAELVRATHPELAVRCDDIVRATDDAIVKNWASWRFWGLPNGLCVFTPMSPGIYYTNWDTTMNRVYDGIGLDFVAHTNWDEVLLEYFITNHPCATPLGPWPGAMLGSSE